MYKLFTAWGMQQKAIHTTIFKIIKENKKNGESISAYVIYLVFLIVFCKEMLVLNDGKSSAADEKRKTKIYYTIISNVEDGIFI